MTQPTEASGPAGPAARQILPQGDDRRRKKQAMFKNHRAKQVGGNPGASEDATTNQPTPRPQDETGEPDDAVEKKTTTRWDTRSILEHPPETPEEFEELAEMDTSWDPGMASQFDVSNTSDGGEEVDEMDMFDTESWAVTEASFPTFAPAVLPEFAIPEPVREVPDPEASDLESRHESTLNGELSEGKTLSCERDAPDGLLKGAQSDESSKLKDDESLLDDCEARSDALDSSASQYGGQASAEQKRLQQLRINIYSGQAMKDPDSSEEEDTATDHESVTDSEADVKYISADSGDEEENATDDATDLAVLAGIQRSTSHEFASFNAAASASKEASPRKVTKTKIAVKVENLELIGTTGFSRDVGGSKAGSMYPDSSVISSLAGEKLLGSVTEMSTSTHVTGKSSVQETLSQYKQHPSDPYRATTRPIHADSTPTVSNGRKKQANDKPLIKIAPPPEEKLRKWEEEKARPFKHLEAMEKAKSGAFASAESPRGEGIEISTVITDSGEELERQASEQSYLKANLVSSQQRRSPNMYDGKIAERLIMASSAAANKFESMVAEDGIRPDSYPTATKSDSLDIEHRRLEGQDGQVKDESSFFCAPDTFRENIVSMTSSSLGMSEQGCSGGADQSQCMNGASSMVCNPLKVSLSLGEVPTQVKSTDSGGVDKMDRGAELVGGAFSPWQNSGFAPVSRARALSGHNALSADHTNQATMDVLSSATHELQADGAANSEIDELVVGEKDLLVWLETDVLGKSSDEDLANAVALSSQQAKRQTAASLERDENLNTICQYVHDRVFDTGTSTTTAQPFSVPTDTKIGSRILAANFVSFLRRLSEKSGVESPFGEENPFLLDIVNSSLKRADGGETASTISEGHTVQEFVFSFLSGGSMSVLRFFYKVCHSGNGSPEDVKVDTIAPQTKNGLEINIRKQEEAFNLRHRVPTESPSPFDKICQSLPSVILDIIGFLGDPVAVCRTKVVNSTCCRTIGDNEHAVMRNAVRCGGMSMNVRPAFWMWIALEKSAEPERGQRVSDIIGSAPVADAHPDDAVGAIPRAAAPTASASLASLEQIGREGKWHHVIQRDVARAFGNMPPHKTGARLRTDSIVRALVTWGRSRLIKRGVKGGGAPGSDSRNAPWRAGENETDETPGDKVSDWGGISPVSSFCSGSAGIGEHPTGRLGTGRATTPNEADGDKPVKSPKSIEELALSGNALTDEMKVDLQNQLGFILHALAAAHEDVGYCQGMDYIVAHLLRVLQDTIRWGAIRGRLPPAVRARPAIPDDSTDEKALSLLVDKAIEQSFVVEETVFRVMDCFFENYNLRHMFWPELRCLKTCCRVFERLIQIKLPVLADHFEHHELNVGLFALGWFQTLFLYLPSMPSQTVCHMWDIWLVERSFKIFFRVGTAILFLSQPILLNHELEGMMTYLNTFPDATLLNPDILIACALQIKVTNRMLEEIEHELSPWL